MNNIYYQAKTPAAKNYGTTANMVKSFVIRRLFPQPVCNQPLRVNDEGVMEVDKYNLSKMCLWLINIVGEKSYPLDELMLMVEAFAYHRPKLVIDIGTYNGKSARIWYELARNMKSGTSVHTIDIMDPNHPEYPGESLGDYIKGTNVVQHIGDSYAVAAEIITSIPSVPTLVFLDGSHEYDIVLRDLELARIIGDGCILVHDTMFQPGSNYNHGPYMAIKHFLESYQAHQVIQVNNGVPGLTYLNLKQRNTSEMSEE